MRVVLPLLLLAALVVIAPLTMSHAQQPNPAELQAFVQTQFYKSLLGRTVAGLPATSFRRCPSLVSDESTLSVLRPVAFGKDGMPVAGQWRHSFPVKGCGDDKTLNFFFSVEPSGRIDTVVGLPGSTRADPLLQHGAIPAAYAGAHAVNKACPGKDLQVTNTRFQAFGLRQPPTPDPGAAAKFRPWWETWTVTGCGHTVDVPVNFVPDDKGVRIMQPAGAAERR